MSRASELKSPLQFGNYYIPQVYSYTLPSILTTHTYPPTQYTQICFVVPMPYNISQFHHSNNEFNEVHPKFRLDAPEFNRKLYLSAFIDWIANMNDFFE